MLRTSAQQSGEARGLLNALPPPFIHNNWESEVSSCFLNQDVAPLITQLQGFEFKDEGGTLGNGMVRHKYGYVASQAGAMLSLTLNTFPPPALLEGGVAPARVRNAIFMGYHVCALHVLFGCDPYVGVCCAGAAAHLTPAQLPGHGQCKRGLRERLPVHASEHQRPQQHECVADKLRQAGGVTASTLPTASELTRLMLLLVMMLHFAGMMEIFMSAMVQVKVSQEPGPDGGHKFKFMGVVVSHAALHPEVPLMTDHDDYLEAKASGQQPGGW